jgi:hypothetical protein
MLSPSQARNFLGAAGAGTVVLLKAPNSSLLPKPQEIRRLFDCEDLKYYKGRGWYSEEIESLERALEIVTGAKHLAPWTPLQTTEWLLLPPGTRQSLFFTLAHSTILIDGFDLTDAGMATLTGHLGRHSNIQDWRITVDRFYSSLDINAASAAKKNIVDPTITSPNLDGVKRLLHGYGDVALGSVITDICHWYGVHKWKP